MDGIVVDNLDFLITVNNGAIDRLEASIENAKVKIEADVKNVESLKRHNDALREAKGILSSHLAQNT